MALFTHSKFYYGFDVDSENFYLDFDEGSGEETGTINVSSYTPTDLAIDVARAMTDAGSQEYSCSFNRTTRRFTISAPIAFDLLITSGSHNGASVFSLLGFTGADLTGLTTYTSNLVAGSEYSTQFMLQSYIDSDDFQKSSEAVVNKSASGEVEVVRFGIEKFMECDFKYITNYDTSGTGSPIRNRVDGVSQFRTFVQFLVEKKPVEFMPDENNVSDFEKMILESTPDSTTGTGYKLIELTSKNLPGVFESGKYRFRVIE